MKFVPMPHQKLALDFARQHDRCGLFLDMGLGKTVVTLTLLKEHLHDRFDIRRALVIAPPNTAKFTWKQEAALWDHTKDLKVSIVSGTPAQRIKILSDPADVYVISNALVAWVCQYWDFDAVVIDELSCFKSYSSQRFKALKKKIASTRLIYGLTGTPAPNGYEDLFSEIFLLDGGERLGRYITNYRDHYFIPAAKKGNIVYSWRLRDGAKEAIDEKLRSLCLYMSKDDWLKLPGEKISNVYVDLDKESRAVYDRLKRDHVLLYNGKNLLPEFDEDFTDSVSGADAAHMASLLLQCASGQVYTDTHDVMTIHQQKIDMLEEVIEELNGSPVLLFYSFVHEKDLILSRFPQAKTLNEDTIEEWNAGKLPILLCHPLSAGHGLNLQRGGNRILWYSLPWSLEQYQQANCRLYRTGQEHTVMRQHLIVRGTYEEKVLRVLNQKDATQNSLLLSLKNYMKE